MTDIYGLFSSMVAVFIEESLNHVGNDGFGCFGFFEGDLQKKLSIVILN